MVEEESITIETEEPDAPPFAPKNPPRSQIRNKKRARNESEEENNLLRSAVDVLNNMTGKKEVCSFGEMVSDELLKLNERQQIFVKKIINDSLYFRSLNMLSETSVINI